MALGALLFVVQGRLPELFPFLQPLQLGKVTILLGLIAVLSINPSRLTVLWKKTPMGRYLLILLVLAFVGIPFSVYKGGAVESFIGLLRKFLIISVVVGLCVGGREQSLRTTLMWLLLLMSSMMIMARGSERVQVSGSYDANDLALLFVVYLPIVANEALLGGKWTKLVASTSAACAVTAVALTGSRGGIIALAAIGLHAILLVKKRRWILIPALALAGFIVTATASDKLWERFQSLQDSSDYNFEAKEGRLTIWKEGLYIMITHPIVGVGLGQFMTGLGTLGSGVWLTAHNSFVQIGTELGVIGLGAFIALLLSIYRLGKQGARAPCLPLAERQRFVALQLGLTGYCVGGFFLSQAYGFILFIFVALAACMHLQLKKVEQDFAATDDAPIPPNPVYGKPFPKFGPLEKLPEKSAKKLTETAYKRAHAVRRAREERLLRGDRLQQNLDTNKNKEDKKV